VRRNPGLKSETWATHSVAGPLLPATIEVLRGKSRVQSLLDSRPLPVYSRHVTSMPYGKHGKHIPRSLSRRPGDDDPRIAPPPASAWICAGPAHPAALQQPAPGGRGLVVPGPAALAESETGQSPVDRFAFDQPSGAHLRDHQNGYKPPGARDIQLRPHAGRYSDGSGTQAARGEFLGGSLR
jgi:hypothetical protein